MIYLDSAATTVQKPPGVKRRIKWAAQHLGSPGRGGHPYALRAAEIAFSCRELAARLFNVDNPENIVFTSNATHGLNIAIKSLASPGDEVVISGYEHNSVVRPLHGIGARVTVASSELFEPESAVSAFDLKIRQGVKLVVCNHVSNVFGYVLPVERIGEICRNRGVPFIIDASQSAGVEDIDFQKLGADFIAMPGHKGLYGPQGTGLLLCGRKPVPLLQGGTGSMSKSKDMPDILPDMLESGTHNMPGIAGLVEGLKFVLSKTPAAIREKEKELTEIACRGLRGVRGIRAYESPHMFCQNGVLSFNIRGMDPEAVGEELSRRNIAVRSGFHCSPLAHETAGTLRTGTVRMSVSHFNRKGEILAFLSAVQEILNKKK